MNLLQDMLDTGIVAILRASRSDKLLKAADALLAGGVRAIEVTLTTPGALKIVEEATQHFGADVAFGAGSVLDPESARAAILAGARFVVCPTVKLSTIELCRRYGVVVMPGAYTPTEILTAWEAGADIVKLFPSDIGGPAYLKAVRAPLPQIRIAPTGGIDLNNAADYIRAGAVTLGIGSALVNDRMLDADQFDAITERARAFVEAVARARGGG